MLSADCQKSGGKGKVLGLHSAVFSKFGDGSTRLNSENDSKITENSSQLRKFGKYLEHFSTNVLPELRRVPGYLEATVSLRRLESEIEILVETMWGSLEAIRN